MLKSIKEKLLSTVTAHPKLVTLGIGLAITFGTTLVLGLVSPHQVYADGAPHIV